MPEDPPTGAAGAGWFADPSRRHRVRYWDGDRWSQWVADGEQPVLEGPTLQTGHQVAHRPAIEPEERFWAQTLIAGAPIFVAMWGGIGLFALTHGGTQAGAFLTSVALVVVVLTSFQPYEAVVEPDGSLVFKALLRSITTNVDSVHRITISGGRAISFVFHFDDRRASLGMFGGRNLARRLIARNPTIERPRSVDRRT
jgi:hypothetical protein